MQKFEMPMMNVEEFEIVDVIMTSGGEGGYNPSCPNEIGCGEDFS